MRSVYMFFVVLAGFAVSGSVEAGVLNKIRQRTGHQRSRSSRPSKAPRENARRNNERHRGARHYRDDHHEYRDYNRRREYRRRYHRRSVFVGTYPWWFGGYGAGLLLYPYGSYRRPHDRGYRPTPQKRVALEERFAAQVEGGTAFLSEEDGKLERYRGAFRLQSPWSIDLSTEFMMLVERLPEGDDRQGLLKSTAWFRVADGDWGQLALGGGYRRLFDREDALNGGHGAGLLRLFPLAPFILEGRLDLGQVGDAKTADWRVSGGLLLGPVEFNLAITGLVFQDVELVGPELSLRLWL